MSTVTNNSLNVLWDCWYFINADWKTFTHPLTTRLVKTSLHKTNSGLNSVWSVSPCSCLRQHVTSVWQNDHSYSMLRGGMKSDRWYCNITNSHLDLKGRWQMLLYQESNDDEIFPRDYELKDIGVHDDRENEKWFLIILVHETKWIKLAAGQDLTS